LGGGVAHYLIKNGKSPVVVGLIGTLGAGKTTFVQGLAQGFDLKSRIISPTFMLLRKYPLITLKNPEFSNLYHLDLYRLEGDINDEIVNLGINEVWNTKGNLVIIEWAEKAIEMLPENAWTVDFSYIDFDTRKIIINNKKVIL